MKGALALLLVALSAVFETGVSAAEIEGRDQQNHAAAIEVTLEHGDNLQARVRIVNMNSSGVSLTSNLDDITKGQFQDFPVIGLLQLRSRDQRIIRDLPAETADGWWCPNILNSNLTNVQFSVRGGPTPSADSFLHRDVIPIGGTTIAFDCGRILQLVSTVEKSPIASARVRLDIKVKGGTVVPITSDWFDVAPEVTGSGECFASDGMT
jgi:hypothetical protein